MQYEEVSEIIKKGGVGVLPTDTIYGLVGSALNPEAVTKVVSLKGRDSNKPFIVLVSDIKDVLSLNPEIDLETQEILKKIWPGGVSVVLPVPSQKFDYLSMGTQTIAMRLPDREGLRELIKKTGPLVAPSANPGGDAPAETIEEARKYFPNLDFYIDDGEMPSSPSTLIKLENGKAKVLRQGKWQVPSFLI